MPERPSLQVREGRVIAVTRAFAVAAAASVLLVAAGCGGGGKSPSVASLGGTTTSSSSRSASPPAGSAQSSGGGGGANLTLKTQNGEKLAQCMRSHGVPNFPDPSASGELSIGAGSGIDPRSPKFQRAMQACQKLLPNGGQPSPQQVAKAQKAALAFSQCMRKHGVKDFPDPTFSGNSIQMRITGRPGSDLNPNSPTFQRARTACQGELPFKGGK